MLEAIKDCIQHPMALNSIILLVAEALFVACLALLLFRMRDRIGLGPLYVFVGTNQFLSVILAASIYVPVSASTLVSPGSAVLFSSGLFVILLVYLRTDIPTSRGLMFGVLIANLALTMLLWFTNSLMQMPGIVNPMNMPIELFTVSPLVFFSGTMVLVMDLLLVVVLYQWLTLRWTGLPLLARILTTLVGVLCFDAIVFSAMVSVGDTLYIDILRGQLAGKIPAGLLFGFILYFYLFYAEPTIDRQRMQGSAADVFSIFTYQERYKEVKDQLEVAEAASLAKSRFLANMSHELRTPLNAIIGFSSILERRAEGATEDHLFLSRVLANSTHLLELINGLLDLSKIESGVAELHIARVNLGELVNETVDQLHSDADEKSLELRAELPRRRIEIATDRMRLKQVLINLIGNSLKFTDHGSVVTRLETDPETGDPLRLDVLDSGIGIADDRLADIFEPFIHEDSSARNEPGVGLGLSISRALCKQMGFALEVTSKKGRGSRFSIIFDPPRTPTPAI